MTPRPVPGLRLRARALLAAALGLLVLAPGTALALSGPDVSTYQHGAGPIGWSAVRAAGSSFAFVKATEGSDYRNGWFGRDWGGIRAAGMDRGAYHFARPSAARGSAAVQARFFASVVGDQRAAGTLPPVLDLEVTGGLSPAALIGWTRTWLDTVQSLTGRVPMIYTFPSFWWTAMAHTSTFADHPLWIAHYTSAAGPSYSGWPSWTFWQYSSSARLDGIAGDVDVSRFHGTAADLARLAGGTASPARSPGGTSPARTPTGHPATGGTPSGLGPGRSVPSAPAGATRTTPSRYVAATPTRVWDSRTGSGPLSGAATLQLPPAVPAGNAGVVLDVSVVRPQGDGYLRAGAPGDAAASTAMSYVAGRSSTALAVARTDGSRRTTLATYGGATDVVVDLVGWYDAAATTAPGGRFVLASPQRFLDTRTGAGGTTGPVAGRVDVRLPDAVPADARAAVLELSVTGAHHDTWVQVTGAGSEPTTTALTVPAGHDRTGLLLPALSGRTLSLVVHGGPAHLVLDLVGWVTGSGAAGEPYVATGPQRLLDTRDSPAPSGTVTLPLPATVPTGTTGVLLSLSVVDPAGDGWTKVGAAGGTLATALTATGGQSQTALVLTSVSAARQLVLELHGAPTQLVVDLVGYTGPMQDATS